MLLPTTVVGSYSVPEWLERLKTDFYQRRISAQHLKEIHDVAIKAALKDQELAGLDIASDGELRRDNDIDYLLARIPGVDIPHRAKTDYYDYYDAQVTKPLPAAIDGGPGLADDFTFARAHTAKPIKFSFTGPFSLSRRIRDSAYTDPADLVSALARWLNAHAAGLAAAGAELLQIDEPFLAGYPEAAELAIAAVNTVTEGVDVSWAPACLLRQPLRKAAVGRALRVPLPRCALGARRPARARVRQEGARRPAPVRPVSVGSRRRPWRHRCQEQRGGIGAGCRRPDRARAGVRASRAADPESRLRAQASADRGRAGKVAGACGGRAACARRTLWKKVSNTSQVSKNYNRLRRRMILTASSRNVGQFWPGTPERRHPF
jgi:Cobalamin-independent synthase, Catalytic domain